MVVTLLGLRFLLELALFATIGLLAARLSPVGWVSWALALGAVAVTVVIWGALLSPRRRLDLRLPLRVGLELALFAAAALGLAWIGLPVWGASLIVTEVLVLAALWALGSPPGADPAAFHEARRRQ